MSVDHTPVRLTATEFDLPVEIASADRHVLTYEQLMNRVWGPLYSTEAQIVHAYVKQLLHKLGDNARHPKYILNERGLGYRIGRLTTRQSRQLDIH